MMLGSVIGGITNNPNHCKGKFEAEFITHPLTGIAISRAYINSCPSETIFLCVFDKCCDGRGAGFRKRHKILMRITTSNSIPIDLWRINISNFIGDKRMLIMVIPIPNMKNIAIAENQ
jgi:hypothetical protein